MKIILPDNLFTRLIFSCLPDEIRKDVEFHPSSLIGKKTGEQGGSVGLLPTMDLILHQDFFVSASFGISFESELCNSYLYYQTHKRNFERINLFGDISSQEAILSRILFKEIYKTEIEVSILTNESEYENQDVLIAGVKNFENEKFRSGISFSEEVIDILSVPYVNYVAASKSEDSVKEFNSIIEKLSREVYDKVENMDFASELSETSREYIKSNISSLILDFDKQDVEAITQLLSLPYFHGMIGNIVDVKFV
jgi:hypothetical protein